MSLLERFSMGMESSTIQDVSSLESSKNENSQNQSSLFYFISMSVYLDQQIMVPSRYYCRMWNQINFGYIHVEKYKMMDSSYQIKT